MISTSPCGRGRVDRISGSAATSLAPHPPWPPLCKGGKGLRGRPLARGESIGSLAGGALHPPWPSKRGLPIEAIDLAGAERELDAAEQGGVGVGFEVGVGEVGDFSGMAVELDQVGACTLPAAGPARLCRTGLVARRISMKGFTFAMILFSRASWGEDTIPNSPFLLFLCRARRCKSPSPGLPRNAMTMRRFGRSARVIRADAGADAEHAA